MRKVGRSVLVLATAAMLISVPASMSLAQGGHHTTLSTNVCSVSPGSVAPGETFTVSASGLPVNHTLNLNELYPSFTRTLIMSTPDGTISVTDTAMQDWGTPAGQTFTVKMQINDVNGRKPVNVSNCSLQVT